MPTDAAPQRDRFDAPMASLARAAHEAIVVIDEAQRVVMLNPAAAEMFRCRSADVLGGPLSRLIPQRFHAAHAGYVAQFGASGVAERTMAERSTVTGLRADGEEFPVAVTIARIDGLGPFANGRHFAALLCDLTVEQELRDEIETLRRGFRTVVEMSPNAMWIAQAERIVFVNRACLALFGAGSPEQLVGRTMYELLHPESRDAVRAEVTRALAADGDGARLQERIERLDGTPCDVEIALAALPDHGRTTLQMVINDITQRRRETQEQERVRDTLRKLSQRLVEVREDERRRIARELHDELGQRLTALKMDLASLAPGTRSGKTRERIAAMLEMLDETVTSVRRISADLRPLMLDDLGLDAAIEWLARDAARRMGIEVKVELDAAVSSVDARSAIALYRMVQEALTNVARHARASEVHIEMKHADGELVLTVRDNGVGFAERATAKDDSFGLLGIGERALMLGGRMEVGNAPGGGGRLRVRLPAAFAAPAPLLPPAPIPPIASAPEPAP